MRKICFILFLLAFCIPSVLAEDLTCQYRETESYVANQETFFHNGIEIGRDLNISDLVKVEVEGYTVKTSNKLRVPINLNISIHRSSYGFGVNEDTLISVTVKPNNFEVYKDSFSTNSGCGQVTGCGIGINKYEFVEPNIITSEVEEVVKNKTVCKQCPEDSGNICLNDGEKSDSDMRCGSGRRNGEGLCDTILKIGDKCDPDRDKCSEGFCDLVSKICTKGLIFETSLSKTKIFVGEEGKISLSVINPTNKDIEVDVSLSVGNGIKISEIEAGDQCGGSICKLDRQTISAGGKKDIIIGIKGVSSTISTITAYLNYQVNGKEISEQTNSNLEVVVVPVCGNGIIETGETSNTCCEDARCPNLNELIYEYRCIKKNHECGKFIKIVVYLILLLLFIVVLTPILTIILKHSLKKKKNRTGHPWTKNEKSQLKKEFLRGISLNKIAKVHKRDPEAIVCRLIMMGLLGFERLNKKPKNHGKTWSKNEDSILKEEFRNNKNIIEIAQKLGREPNSVLFRLILLGLIKPEEAIAKYKRR